MEFRILGPLEVIGDDGASVAVGGSRERGVLALLLLSANRVVPSERLAADLWGDRAPEGAAHALRVHVSRLRRALREAGVDGMLVTQSPGYVARVPPGALDAARFEALLGRGREAASRADYRAAAEMLGEALALWRGPALPDLPEAPAARAEAVRLEEARLVALEERIDADLACGRQAELVGELEGLTQVHPLREHLWYLRMLALYRAGRQAEALAAYQELRHLLDDELGIAPTDALNRLQTAILRQDPELALPPVEAMAPAASSAGGIVTVLVTDLDTAGDEQDQWIFHAFRNLVADTATELGGYELQSPGRGIAAAFPTAAAALRAALRIREGAPRPLGGQQVAVRTGLEAGSSPGDQVVVAQRLCEQAEGDRIVCTPTVRDLLDGQLPDAAAVSEVSPATAPQVPMPPLLTEIGRVFVGRTAELGRLNELWADIGRRTPRVAVVAGEPGVGKTRLAAEFARQVHADGRMVLAGRCDEDLGVPYQPFVEALRQFVDHTPAALLDQGLGRHGGELVRLVPEIAQRRPDLPPGLRSDPETERYRLFDAVAAWLGAASGDQPLLLVLDDLHWAAKPTLLLLRHVSRSPEAPRLLMVCTYRDTELGHHHPLADLLADLRRQVGVERIELSGLDEAAIITFLEEVGGHHLDEGNLAMAKAIHEGTEGNPFFVREVIRHLTETEKLQRQEGRWQTRLPARELGITQGVREVVGMRLGRLGEETGKVLRVAAVVGAEFDPPMVQEVGGFTEEALLSALDEATSARLVLEVPGAALRYRFAHAIVRATLHDELTSARRTALHRRVATAIEALHAGVHDEYLPALAYHWARAATGPDDAARAVDYAARAGARALTLLANDEAVTYYRQALGLLTVAHGLRDEPRRVELLIALGEAQRRAGDAGHRETLLEAARLARARGDAQALALAAVANSPGSKPSAFGITDHDRVETLEAAIEALGTERQPAEGPSPGDPGARALPHRRTRPAPGVERRGPGDRPPARRPGHPLTHPGRPPLRHRWAGHPGGPAGRHGRAAGGGRAPVRPGDRPPCLVAAVPGGGRGGGSPGGGPLPGYRGPDGGRPGSAQPPMDDDPTAGGARPARGRPRRGRPPDPGRPGAGPGRRAAGCAAVLRDPALPAPRRAGAPRRGRGGGGPGGGHGARAAERPGHARAGTGRDGPDGRGAGDLRGDRPGRLRPAAGRGKHGGGLLLLRATCRHARRP